MRGSGGCPSETSTGAILEQGARETGTARAMLLAPNGQWVRPPSQASVDSEADVYWGPRGVWGGAKLGGRGRKPYNTLTAHTTLTLAPHSTALK